MMPPPRSCYPSMENEGKDRERMGKVHSSKILQLFHSGLKQHKAARISASVTPPQRPPSLSTHDDPSLNPEIMFTETKSELPDCLVPKQKPAILSSTRTRRAPTPSKQQRGREKDAMGLKMRHRKKIYLSVRFICYVSIRTNYLHRIYLLIKEF